MSTPVSLAGPLTDPEAHAPTTSRQVEKALDRATVAASEAQLRWRQLQDALEANAGVSEASLTFQRTLVESVYRWSVYHAASFDHARDSHRVA